MKKCLVLKTDSPPSEAKKLARDVKKAHEKLFGKGSCQVVILPLTAEVFTVCEDNTSNCLNLISCDVEGCPKKTE